MKSSRFTLALAIALGLLVAPFTHADDQAAQPTDAAQPTEVVEQAEAPQTAEAPPAAEAAPATEAPPPAEVPQPAEVPPTELPPPAEVPQPVEVPLPAETPEPTEATPPAPAPVPPAEAEAEFPTPAQLFERMKKLKEQKAALSKVAWFDLSAMPVLEKPASFSLFADTTPYTLRAWVERLHAARDDKDVRGVLITIGGASGLNLAQAQELRDAMVELRRAGKKTFVYADSYDTVSYTVASGATDVCLLEGGEIMIPGVGLEATFYKGILEKIGVKADYVQIGEYKGADESYTRTEASEQLKGELNRLTDAMYDQLISEISHNRSVSSEAVKQLVDDTIVSARSAKDRGFVDHLVHQDDLRKLVTAELGNEIDLISNYGQAPPDGAEGSPLSMLSGLFAPPTEDAPKTEPKPAVALIYAEGVIVDGEGGDGIFSDSGVGSSDIRRSLRLALRDPDVKAIVIRIDSPGGSALASEVMWQATRAAATQKPVIISIGSMAASGGYYLACAGDHIFADPSAIIGSIGVVGGKFVFKDLFDKLGIVTESFARGRNADLFSSSKPFDERQRRLLTNWMKGTYDQFTERVMTTRKDKIKDIDQVARGRIFIAKQAKELGMVDELGGIDAALAYAGGKAGLGKGGYDVKVLPQPKTLTDLLNMAMGGPQAAAMFQPKITLSEASVLHALDGATRKAVGQQLQMMRLLQDRPVVLISPFVVTMR